jgi:hypothetical protein
MSDALCQTTGCQNKRPGEPRAGYLGYENACDSCIISEYKRRVRAKRIAAIKDWVQGATLVALVGVGYIVAALIVMNLLSDIIADGIRKAGH